MNVALILISGKGERMGLNIPKQFVKVNDHPLYLYSYKTFHDIKEIDKILVVTNKEYIDIVKHELKINKLDDKLIDVIIGGEARYQSSFNGIKYLTQNGFKSTDNVLIHDGARPNISKDIIINNITSLSSYDACVTMVESNNKIINTSRIDTIHKLNNKIYKAQTPQSFKLNLIYDLYLEALTKEFKFTDDISLVIEKNIKFDIVNGDESNYKITNKNDLDRFIREEKTL